MLSLLRKKLGNIKRGLTGLRHSAEFVPSIPKDLKKFSLGKSVKGKNIEGYEIGDGPTPLLFVGGIHGNEVGSMKAVVHLLFNLATNHRSYPKFTFYIVPILNVDGFAEAIKRPNYFGGGKIGRFNDNGVDLNRNFPTKSFKSRSQWNFGKDFSEKEEVYCGESPGSEPENRALRNFIAEKGIKFLMIFHNAAGSVMGNENGKSQSLAASFAQASGYRKEDISEWKSLEQTGTAREWCDEQGIIYIEPEGRFRWGSDWKNQKAGVQAILKEIG